MHRSRVTQFEHPENMFQGLDSFCGSVFWNDSLLDRPDPDLPVCLEQTVLVWIPLGFLWLSAPWHLATLFKRKSPKSRLSKIYIFKQVLAGLLLLTAVSGLTVTLVDRKNSAVFYTNPTLFAISWILVMLCQEGVRRREKAVDSGSLFFFWLLLVVCEIFPFQTLLREALNQGEIVDLPRFCLFYIGFGLELTALVTSAIADASPEIKEKAKKNPKVGASFLSRITFSWLNSLIITGYKRPLVSEDLWELDLKEDVHHIRQDFDKVMKEEFRKARVRLQKQQSGKMSKRRPHLHQTSLVKGISQDALVMEEIEEMKGQRQKRNQKGRGEVPYPHSWLFPTIVKTFKWVLLKSAIFKLLQALLAFVSPQLLKVMIHFIQDRTIHEWKGYMCAVLFLLVTSLQSLFEQQYTKYCFLMGRKVQAIIVATVYKKALTMSNNALKDSTVGQTVTLMSADAQRIREALVFIHLCWLCPLQIALSTVFLWLELGPSVLAGLFVMVLLVPINGLLATRSRGFQVKNMGHKDKRMKLMNEILNGIKILKLYTWEPSFEVQVESIREQELKVMRKSSYLSSVSTLTFTCAPALVSVLTFAVFVSVSSENVLDPQKAFTSISLFNILRFPMGMLPQIISALVQMVVSIKRLEKFQGGEDLDPLAVEHDSSLSTSVSVQNGTFAWDSDNKPVLKNISLDINPGRLVAVVGAVGSGKSSLISALLGEMNKLIGHISVKGSLAYVPQQAWIQNATLKDNILFGSELDEKKYQQVLDACALRPDLDQLPGGDQTEIGEKGINLSGGQKQRVSLARAAYSSADTYLLDDPLSAVDSHVGKHLFERVIGPNGLLKDKTRVLVTHGVNFLPYVDEIVVLVDGIVSEVGSYNSLRASGGAFSEFLETYAKEENKKSDAEEDPAETDPVEQSQNTQDEATASVTVTKETSSCHSQGHSNNSSSVAVKKSSSTNNKKQSENGKQLIQEERLQSGDSVAFIGSNLWLSEWTGDAVKYYNTTYPVAIRDMRVGIFGGLGVTQGVLVFLGALLLVEGAVSASRTLHTDLLSSILQLPMHFFDTTPSGRVINRFAKELFTVDEMIPPSFSTVLLRLLEMIANLVIVCLATPLISVVVIPLTVVYCFLQRFYVATSRQLRRLDSVSLSPIYSHFGETLAGLPVIRAYGHQERFIKQNETIIDNNMKSFYMLIFSNKWVNIRLEMLGNLVVFFAALFAVVARDHLDGSVVGLSITYALNVTHTLIVLVRTTSQLETNIVAMERISEYIEIEKEAPWITDHRPPDDWPSEGKLRFEDYKVRYRPELDLVLNGITCDIDSSEKIGIVGRTGAGKSSLTNCLFRIIEAAEGRILIDGVDIAKLGLHDLRSRLTIIPQDPVLFSGTLRLNLDPFERFSDADIWRVLELSHLKDFVSGLAAGLQHEVSEGGENLSVGQRQLLCLARALLRKSRILILDEATAAVDLETDNLIQTTIRKEFSHCTVLTIAHRLNTILDSSRVMVLDAGRIVEFDSPSALLEKQGYFYALVRDAGLTGVDDTKLEELLEAL
ncbi:canalicular multispecific organic anion transporter 1 isoform X2 [Chanos chanos]|uniref:ABC-type glutathione-S-conjugate transporter n=1 Tax=Chanos chanos TaxID=29144 RepID=A0A6J2V3P7_CHACN|nr:canalicular multispecific organic anion transporter 1-like isoform X2 [Chanos chanos]